MKNFCFSKRHFDCKIAQNYYHHPLITTTFSEFLEQIADQKSIWLNLSYNYSGRNSNQKIVSGLFFNFSSKTCAQRSRWQHNFRRISCWKSSYLHLSINHLQNLAVFPLTCCILNILWVLLLIVRMHLFVPGMEKNRYIISLNSFSDDNHNT